MGIKGKKQHKYHDEWIKENFNAYYNNALLTKAYNEHFGCSVTLSAFRTHLKYLGLKRDLKCGNEFKYNDEWIRQNRDAYKYNNDLWRAYIAEFGECPESSSFSRHLRIIGLSAGHNAFTQEQDEWLKANYPIMSRKDCTKLFNETFNDSRDEGTIKVRATKYLGLKVDKETRSESLHKSNARNIGSEITLKVGGRKYIFIKVKNDKGARFKNFIPKARYIWELAFGEIPAGHQVVHLDGDTMNCSLDNLACISTADCAIMTANRFWGREKEVVRTAVKWVNLYKEVRDRKGE